MGGQHWGENKVVERSGCKILTHKAVADLLLINPISRPIPLRLSAEAGVQFVVEYRPALSTGRPVQFSFPNVTHLWVLQALQIRRDVAVR